MPSLRDRILIVENDPVISDLIGRQALQAVGYQVQVAADANTAISRALQWSPDLIIIDLNLPGLSGKDLMVALSSQGLQAPMLVIAKQGSEADLIQAFRLGAADYLLLPVREAEVVNAVARVLQQIQDRKAREQMAQQLQQANQQLQRRVRELTTIFALGKAMTSITEQSVLLDKILDGALSITQAETGWFLLREDTGKPFLVVAERNLSPALGVQLNQPWDDGISSLVALSGEVLSIHGEALRRFKISALGRSALIVPVKAQSTVIGLLVMLRKQAEAFGASETNLLSALADYASISLVNARLFRAVEERARAQQRTADAAQLSGKVNNDILRVVRQVVSDMLAPSMASIIRLTKDPMVHLRADQRQQLALAQDQQQAIQRLIDTIDPLPLAQSMPERTGLVLNNLLASALQRYQPVIQNGGFIWSMDLPRDPLRVNGDSSLLARAIDGLICAVVKCSQPGARIILRLSRTGDNQAHVIVFGMDQSVQWHEAQRLLKDEELANAFSSPSAAASRQSGAGVRLCLVKEIFEWHNGKLWLERKAVKGAEFHVSLPLVR